MSAASDARPRVLLVTEGTYPHHWGGLSTWADLLMRELDDVDFLVLALTEDPSLPLRFEWPANLVELRTLPLWGVRDAWELRGRRRRARAATDAELRCDFGPQLGRLLAQILAPEDDPLEVGRALHLLYRFFTVRDFDAAFRSRTAWYVLEDAVARRFGALARSYGHPEARVTRQDVVDGARWLRHWLFPLADELPEVDVAHATMAGLCGVVAAVEKLEHGARFVLSEHGIYLRESYLAGAARTSSLFAKVLRLRFAEAATGLAYALADCVAPCCDYNTRWERRLGVPAERLRTAYYGVEASRPRPAAGAAATPVVVWAGRIDPLKDVETLLEAAALVLAERPDTTFRLLGAAPPGNEEYRDRCLRLHESLGLGERVRFEGYCHDPAAVMAAADVVVLSSISEGFPFVTLEAMAQGSAIVATAVGGIEEQLGDAGVVVRPRDARALARAIVHLIADPGRRAALSSAAYERAAELFSLERFRATHRALYDRSGAAA